MTTVQNHIRELLFEQDCVVIPDFGGFVTNFDCAKVDKAEEYIKPAQKWLAFNGLLKNDDGLLSNYIAKNEGVSRDVANLKIKLFVETAKKGIRFDQRFDIAGVGTFTENEEGKIQFNPSENSNFLGESFGLEKIVIKKSTFIQPIIQVESINTKVSQKTIQQVFASNDRETSAQEIKVVGTHKVSLRKNRKGTVVLKFLLGMFSAVLFVSAIYLYDNEKNSLSSFNPFHFSQKQVKEAYAEPVEKVIPKVEPAKLTPVLIDKDTLVKVSTPIINDTENRFFVITGSFGETENAENQLNVLKSKGFSKASILKPGKKGRLIKVSAGGFTDEESANEEAVKVAKAINQNAWIFKK
ncbi:SPOR domain-containing protein [Arcicella rosea]|uniref:Cell division septation protein DedD n=1 Tax=Arcicella rosea TaxID=502909 RepID=A0A841EN48_9BACT|nr:SPOR domain-containing protein [Arcicella rosea]MBB6004655.1 cell division septation protein DedD [Arcicella rosea]